MFQNNSKILAIIPARGGSKRLKDKNILPMWGNPMLYWANKACKKITPYVFVSTESDKIKEVCRQYNIKYINRPLNDATDTALKQTVLIHATEKIESLYGFKFDFIISAQANSPEIKSVDLIKGLKCFEESPDLQEVFTVDENLKQHGTFRIFRRDRLFVKTMSYKTQVIVNKCIDIHTQKDYNICMRDRQPENYIDVYV